MPQVPPDTKPRDVAISRAADHQQQRRDHQLEERVEDQPARRNVVVGEPEALNNDKTGQLNGHSVDLAQMGETIRFYIPASVLPSINQGDELQVGGKLKVAPTGWAKATSCTQAKLIKKQAAA